MQLQDVQAERATMLTGMKHSPRRIPETCRFIPKAFMVTG